VSTKFVAQTVRNYVEQFFDCEVCKEYFVEMFDRCGFNHCRRFKQPQKLPPPESWAEFAMWLWEVHNDVNLKLVEAESQREGGNVGISKRKLDLTAWPPADECPSCRDVNGKWKKDAILGHLKTEYWYVIDSILAF
jgi:thiol oxidase